MLTEYRHDLAEMDLTELEQALESIGHARFHARQLFQWVHKRGVTDASGLFFIGLPWQHTRGSALIGFVKDDAAYIAGRIESQLEDPAGLVGTDAERA